MTPLPQHGDTGRSEPLGVILTVSQDSQGSSGESCDRTAFNEKAGEQWQMRWRPRRAARSAKVCKAGALGLWGTPPSAWLDRPAYSLAATLGYVVLAVGDKAPAMFIVAFIPMLLVALGLPRAEPGRSGLRHRLHLGHQGVRPVVGWLGGWGLAVSGIIVLANVAEIAAIYLLLFLGRTSWPRTLSSRSSLGVVFIAMMTWMSYRGIVLGERIQVVLVTFQFLV